MIQKAPIDISVKGLVFQKTQFKKVIKITKNTEGFI